MQKVAVERESRMKWLDMLKGMAACFVVLSHISVGQTWYYVVTGPIMLPLFFIVTGYTFNKNRTPLEFLRVNILQRLVMPLLCLSLSPIHVLKRLVIDRSLDSAAAYILQLISGDIMWYVYCSIFAVSIFYCTSKISGRFFERKKMVAHLALCIAISAFGLICAHFDVLNICRLNTACIVQIYLWMGVYLKEKSLFNGSKLMKRPWFAISVSAAIYIGLVVLTLCLFPGQYFDLNRNMYYNVPIVFAMIISGNFALVQTFLRCRPSGLLAYIGRNSLIYYSLHSLCFAVAKKALEFMPKVAECPALSWVIMFLAAIIGCAICAEIINRFLPFATGRQHKK